MSNDTRLNTRRRQLVVTASAIALGAPAIVRAQSGPKIRIGYWPVAAGLPFYAAVEKGTSKKPASTSSRSSSPARSR